MNDKAQFTPGPWECDKEGVVHKEGDRCDLIKTISPWREDSWIEEPEALANMQLIAAAPDMYEALEELISIKQTDKGRRWDTARIRAIHLLAKARGEV